MDVVRVIKDRMVLQYTVNNGKDAHVKDVNME